MAAAKKKTPAKSKAVAAVKSKAAAGSGKKTAAAGSARTVRTVSAKQATKRTAEKAVAVPVTRGLFSGAKSIEFTENAISVTHATSRNRKGAYEKTERRRYMPKTPETAAAANAAIRSGNVKKVRVEFKN